MFFTAHSLRSLEPQRTLRFFILLFSVERTENNKKQALRAFRVQKYRVAIDFFLLPSSQRKKKSISSLRSLRLCLPYEIHFNEERSEFHWGGEYFFMKTPSGVVVDCWELWVGQAGLLFCIGSDFSIAGDSLLVTIKTFRKITLIISLK